MIDNLHRTDYGYMVTSAPGVPDAGVEERPLVAPAPYALAPEEETAWLFVGESGGMNTVSGQVTLNHYETPDQHTNPLIWHTNQPFKGARVDIENNATGATQSTFADANGNYSFSGLNSGTHTVTFFIENERARIISGVDLSKRQKSFTINVSGSTTQDYAWGWGDDGDVDQSTMAMGLNVVYQVNEQYDYVRNTLGYTGMDGLPQRAIEIDTTEAGETAPWLTPPLIIMGRQFALSSEVTHHEYMHNVIYELNGGEMIHNGCGANCIFLEAHAMNEAFADYFTCSHANNHVYGGPSDQANDPSFQAGDGVTVRLLFNSCTMNDFNGAWPCGGTPHSRGMIIAGAVWKVRNNTGTITDDLVFEALQIAPRPQTFARFGQNLYGADDLLNGSGARAKIEQRFVEREILPPLAPTFLTAFDGGGEVDLLWNNLSSLEDGYDVERRLNGGSWTTQASLAANTTSYTDTNVLCRSGSNDYEYRIRVYEGTLEDYSPIRAYNPCQGGGPRVVQDNNRLGGELHEARPSAARPAETSWEEAYPNPFNPQTTIRYALASATNVRLVVYDMLGRAVETLVDGVQQAGRYDVSFVAENLPSGLYLYRLETGEAEFSKTMLLVK